MATWTSRKGETREEKLERERVRSREIVKRYRKELPIKYLCSIARRRAKSRGIEFNIDHSDLTMISVCPLLGIPIDMSHPCLDFHASIDRIDSSKGYIKGNVMLISHRANRIKSDANAEELLMLATNLKRYEVSL